MKGKAVKMKKIGTAVFLILSLTVLFTLFTFAADDNFEKSIAAFPESYKPYLRELHEKYPKWEFVPFMTNLDWNDVVEGEYGVQSLVHSSSSSKIWKSHDEGDFDPVNNTFYYKDGGFVQANRFAVEYFIDPRNFLTEDSIFQFEILEFSENYTIDMIEKILKGSFMSKAKISYYKYSEKNDQLTKVNTNETYAQVIYDAGKTYNINPCYLASKILNEVGSDGSYSIYGDHPTYPGIYNFYNIGATDGSGAIARGLLWAKGGTANKTTYGRPWNTPRKSIMGGAQFLSEEYIAKGQFTGYLQRFNVNPDGYYKLYNHQYMTNLTGALSQGYTTFASYASFGMLDTSITFSIPVYENMSGQDNAEGTMKLTDTRLQHGTVNSSRAALKTGPAKSYADVKTSSGSAVAVASGAKVKIISKHFTDSEYYLNILACPIWYKVSITVNSVTYQGYVDADFVDITTTTNVTAGEFDVQFFKTNNNLYGGLVSSDYRYCTVSDGDTVKFLKNGSVYITSYNSTGGYDKAKYTVTSTGYAVKNLKTSAADSSVTVSVSKNTVAEKYGFFLVNSETGEVKVSSKTTNKTTFKNLESGTKYDVFARYVLDYGYVNGPMKKTSFTVRPDIATNLTYSTSQKGGYTLKWTTAAKATGYEVYFLDETSGENVRIGTVNENKGTFDITAELLKAGTYAVKTFLHSGDTVLYSDFSDPIVIERIVNLTVVDGYAVSGRKTNSMKISWNEVADADGYRFYQKIGGKWTLITETADTSYTVNNLESGTKYSFTVKAYADVGENRLMSPAYKSFSTVTKVSSVTNLTLTSPYATQVKLTWDKVQGATGYRIYLYNSAKNSWKTLATVADSEYLAKNLTEAREYRFSVRALIQYDGEKITSNPVRQSTTTRCKRPTLTVTNTASGTVKLIWSNVERETGYQVWYKSDTDSSYKKLSNYAADKTTASKKGLEKGKTYSFKVRAYKKVDNRYVYSLYSKVKTINVK